MTNAKYRFAYRNIFVTINNDTSFSLFSTLFLYIKRATSFKDKLLGDKYTKIVDNLKGLLESDKVYKEKSNFLLQKEYFKFCSALTLETEIFFVKENSRDDKELFIEACKNYGQALYFASENLRSDKEVVKLAVENKGIIIKYASKDLINDKELALIAVKQNKQAYHFISEQLKQDEEIKALL